MRIALQSASDHIGALQEKINELRDKQDATANNVLEDSVRIDVLEQNQKASEEWWTQGEQAAQQTLGDMGVVMAEKREDLREGTLLNASIHTPPISCWEIR